MLQTQVLISVSNLLLWRSNVIVRFACHSVSRITLTNAETDVDQIW